MSTKAYVVLRFGNTVVHLYRHWGGDPEITGMDILEKIENASRMKERDHFHDGGYILRQMLDDSDGQLPQYQAIDGTIGLAWSYGYEISQDGTYEKPGPWLIRYSEIDEHNVLNDWVHGARVYTVPEFAEFVKDEVDHGIATGKVYDIAIRAAMEKRYGPRN